jgi:hypothetical protein
VRSAVSGKSLARLPVWPGMNADPGGPRPQPDGPCGAENDAGAPDRRRGTCTASVPHRIWGRHRGTARRDSLALRTLTGPASGPQRHSSLRHEPRVGVAGACRSRLGGGHGVGAIVAGVRHWRLLLMSGSAVGCCQASGCRARVGGSRPARSQPTAAAVRGRPTTVTVRWRRGTWLRVPRSSW